MCPFLERSHPRCTTHLHLHNIQQAFAHCAGRFDTCPVYKDLTCHQAATYVAQHTQHVLLAS